MIWFALCKLDILKRVQLKLWSISMIFIPKKMQKSKKKEKQYLKLGNPSSYPNPALHHKKGSKD